MASTNKTQIATIANHYGVSHNVIEQCVVLTTNTLANTGQRITNSDVLACVTDAIQNEFLLDAQFEIAARGSVKTFIGLCTTNTEHLQLCLKPGFLKSYLSGRSFEDGFLIFKFVTQYINTHPNLFIRFVDAFIEEYKSKFPLPVSARPKGKSKVTKPIPNSDEDILGNIRDLNHAILVQILSVIYDESVHGSIGRELQTSILFKVYYKRYILNQHLFGFPLPTDQSVLFSEFLSDLISYIQVKDRKYDSKILDLIPIMMEEDENDDDSDIEDQDSEESLESDPYIINVEMLYFYIKTNSKSKEDTKYMKNLITDRLKNKKDKKRWLKEYDGIDSLEERYK